MIFDCTASPSPRESLCPYRNPTITEKNNNVLVLIIGSVLVLALSLGRLKLALCRK
jgi:hypothetical protein